ncbi:unnamed protein product [Amoebophrya sp. A120]|nr:unnamed protein product [Amoebophrya sp. A120]|eukprot:GSA120T00007253001.1
MSTLPVPPGPDQSLAVTQDVDDDDCMDLLQGRWQTSDQDFLVVEADQVWFLGETAIYGNLSADKTDDGRIHVNFNVKQTGAASDTDAESFGGTFQIDGDMTTIIWADGDIWRKMVPGEGQISPSMSISRQKSESVAISSATGKTIGRLNSGLSFELDEDGQERRWTKNGQLGSSGNLDRVAE